MDLKLASPMPTIKIDKGESLAATMASTVFSMSSISPSVRIKRMLYFWLSLANPFFAMSVAFLMMVSK
jgi:hypothetical protein